MEECGRVLETVKKFRQANTIYLAVYTGTYAGTVLLHSNSQTLWLAVVPFS